MGGRRILDRLTDLLTEVLGSAPLLVANAPEASTWHPGLAVTGDLIAGAGALGGIHAALSTGPPARVLCVAWDLPFLTAPLLDALIQESPSFDAFLPESGGPRHVEPLCAVYGPACIPAIVRRAAGGDYRAVAFHDAVRVGTLPLARVREWGDPAHLFFNVNTPDDVERAERAWRPPG